MLIKTVVAQASFVAALMFYLGAIYTSRYYGYFHLSFHSLDFSFAQLVLQSLQLLKHEFLVTAVLILIVMVAVPQLTPLLPRSSRRALNGSAASASLTRLSMVITAAGGVLLIFWSRIHPYAWTAPLAIAVGLLLGQSRDVKDNRPEGPHRRAVLVLASGVFLFWALTQATWQLGEEDAKDHAADVVGWTSVIVLSSKPLSLPPPGVQEERLRREDLRHPYRYTGLRLLLEHHGRYYVVPVDWKARTDPVYVIHESDDLWIGLQAGAQPASR
ncbi:hypothetical protein ACWCXB_09565 [Streptomyces sp. NPDC001514]